MKDWQPIPGFESLYVINKDAEVARITPLGLRFLSPGRFPNGYLFVRLTKNGKRHNSLLHRLVAIVFITNPNNYPEINHKDLDKSNCALGNLEWCTRSQNVVHSLKNNPRRKKRSDGRIVIDLNTGIFYSVNELCSLYGYNGSTLRGKLNGNDYNNTNYRYA